VTAISLLIARGDTALARARLDHVLDTLGPESPVAVRLLPLRVSACLAEQDLEEAAATSKRLDQRAEEIGHQHVVAIAAFAAAECAAASGAAEATKRIQAARELFRRLELPLDEGRALLLLAQVASAGAPDLAVAEGRAALEIFERLGARSYADEAANLLRTLGVKGRAMPREPGPLTKRELEVLTLLEQGLSNKEIASRLYITPKTAGHHVSKILSKLDLRSRAEAAAYAARVDAERSDAK
jgi:DNA-binding NarL/FixJ family response regulator